MAANDHDIPDLDRKGLREFGLTTGGIVAVLFGLFFPWLLERPWPRWPWVVLLVLGGWALIAPASLRPVYRTWMRFGLLLSKVTSPVIMAVIFFVLITPIALIRRLRGKNSMTAPFQTVPSYRLPSPKPPDDGLKRPY
jgi:hypothetical protein